MVFSAYAWPCVFLITNIYRRTTFLVTPLKLPLRIYGKVEQQWKRPTPPHHKICFLLWGDIRPTTKRSKSFMLVPHPVITYQLICIYFNMRYFLPFPCFFFVSSFICKFVPRLGVVICKCVHVGGGEWLPGLRHPPHGEFSGKFAFRSKRKYHYSKDRRQIKDI